MTRIGVDIGALYLKAVRVDDEGRIAASVYERHRGEPADVLAEALDRLAVQPDEPVGLTGCNAELFAAQLQVPIPRRDALPDRRRSPDGARRVRRHGHRRRVGHAHPARRQGQVRGLLDQLAVRRGHRVVPRRAGGPAGDFVRGHQKLPPQSQSSDHRHALHGVREERPHPPPAGRLQPDGHVVGPVPRHDADGARHAAQRAAPRGQDHPPRRRRAEPGSGQLAPARLPGPHRRAGPAPPRRGLRRGALGQAGPERPGARGQARGRGVERERPLSVAAHAREVDAPVVRDPAGLRRRRGQRGARHALARGRDHPRLPRHRHRLDQHQGHPDRRGGRRRRRHLPEDGRRPRHRDEAALPRDPDAGRRQALGARHRRRGHDGERPQDRRPRHRRRRHHQRDFRARGRRRARGPVGRHDLRDRRAGRQVHARASTGTSATRT